MEDSPKQLPAAFYRSPAGTEPVRDWLKELSAVDRPTLGYDTAWLKLDGRWECHSADRLARAFGKSEAHSAATGFARVIFCVAHGRMILLHGFIKKTQKTPQSDLELARRRQKEVGR